MMGSSRWMGIGGIMEVAAKTVGSFVGCDAGIDLLVSHLELCEERMYQNAIFNKTRLLQGDAQGAA